jgi:hypothetical protein
MLGIGHHHGGEGPERLLTVAGRLFAAKGFVGASVREILQAADVSRPVLYYHFGSKEGLYLAVARRAATDYEAALARAAAGPGTAAERIRRVCRVHASAVRGGILLAMAAESLPLAASATIHAAESDEAALASLAQARGCRFSNGFMFRSGIGPTKRKQYSVSGKPGRAGKIKPVAAIVLGGIKRSTGLGQDFIQFRSLVGWAECKSGCVAFVTEFRRSRR